MRAPRVRGPFGPITRTAAARSDGLGRDDTGTFGRLADRGDRGILRVSQRTGEPVT
ncbi:MAG: hypothetical protein INF93_13060 [Rhodobacter sp.]|nr:hypothetical protein [Rhodobacter sp.]